MFLWTHLLVRSLIAGDNGLENLLYHYQEGELVLLVV